jgi:hypothetical protein
MDRCSLLLGALLAAPAAVLGEDVGGRPAPEHAKAATADPSPVEPGVIEVDLGYEPTWNDRGGTAGFDRSEPGDAHRFAATLTYGVVAGVDLSVSGGFGAVHDAGHLHDDGSAPKHGGGLSDVAFGARWRFLHLAATALELAATADVVAPSGSRCSATRIGLSQEYWSARGALVASKDVGAATSNLEVGLEAPLSGDAGGLRSVLQANGAVGYQVTGWLQPEVELNYETAIGPAARALAVTAGVVAPLGRHRLVAAVQRAVWGRNAVQTTSGIFAVASAF